MATYNSKFAREHQALFPEEESSYGESSSRSETFATNTTALVVPPLRLRDYHKNGAARFGVKSTQSCRDLTQKRTSSYFIHHRTRSSGSTT
ncbi:unnamed protein product, partial [Amoebophrya sp. A120]|eukprot:GSA120T00005957001.1